MERAYKFSRFYAERKTNGHCDKVIDRILWEVPCGSKTWAARQKKNKCQLIPAAQVENFGADKGWRRVAW